MAAGILTNVSMLGSIGNAKKFNVNLSPLACLSSDGGRLFGRRDEQLEEELTISWRTLRASNGECCVTVLRQHFTPCEWSTYWRDFAERQSAITEIIKLFGQNHESSNHR